MSNEKSLKKSISNYFPYKLNPDLRLHINYIVSFTVIKDRKLELMNKVYLDSTLFLNALN